MRVGPDSPVFKFLMEERPRKWNAAMLGLGALMLAIAALAAHASQWEEPAVISLALIGAGGILLSRSGPSHLNKRWLAVTLLGAGAVFSLPTVERMSTAGMAMSPAARTQDCRTTAGLPKVAPVVLLQRIPAKHAALVCKSPSTATWPDEGDDLSAPVRLPPFNDDYKWYGPELRIVNATTCDGAIFRGWQVLGGGLQLRTEPSWDGIRIEAGENDLHYELSICSPSRHECSKRVTTEIGRLRVTARYSRAAYDSACRR